MKIEGNGTWAKVKAPTEEERPEVTSRGTWDVVAPKTHEQTFKNVINANPDNIAEIQRVSRKLNTSPQFVQNNLDHARQFADRPDFEKISKLAPTLSTMAREEYFLALAKDDTDILSKIEGTIASPDNDPTWMETLVGTSISATAQFLGVGPAVMTRATKETNKEGSEEIKRRLNQEFRDYYQKQVLDGKMTDAQMEQKMAARQISRQSQIGQDLDRFIEKSADPAIAEFLGNVEGYYRDVANDYAPKFTGSFEENPSFKRGVSALVSGGMSLGIAIITSMLFGPNAAAALLSFSESSSVYDEAKAKGLSSREAYALTMKTGIITMALEKFGLDYVLGRFSKGNTRSTAAGFLEGGVGEGGTELAQTWVQNAISKYGYDETIGILDGSIEALIGGTGTGSIAGGSISYANNKSMKDRAERTQSLLNELSSSAEASRLKERSPETFADYINRIAADRGKDTKVYVDAQTVVEKLQQAGVDVIAWANKYGVTSEDLATEIARGGDLAIDLGTAAANIGVDETLALFQEDLTLTPSDVSMSQVDSETQIDEAVTTGLAEEYRKEQDRLVKPEEVDQLKQAMLDSGLPAQAAEQYSLIMAARANTWAKATGKTAAEWFQRQGISMERIAYADFKAKMDAENAAMYGQDGQIDTKSEAFKTLFAETSIVDENGNPVQVVHSSPLGTIETFDTWRSSMGAHFGSPDQSNARTDGAAGATSYPVYLNIKNPLRVVDTGNFGPIEISQQMADQGLISQADADSFRYDSDFEDTMTLQEMLTDLGYDGLVYVNRFEAVVDQAGEQDWAEKVKGMSDAEFMALAPEAKDSFVAFKAEQIKSVFNQNPTSDPNILNQAASTQEQLDSDAEWAGWEPSTTKGGKIKGAPPQVKTAADMAELETYLMQLIQEGRVGRYWYEQSARSVMRLVGNDPVQAEQFIQLLAIYSPQANVEVNTYFAVKAWNQWKAGVSRDDFQVKTADQDGKAIGVLYDGKPFEGRKTSSFYTNLMHEILVMDPTAADRLSLDADILKEITAPATIDMWMYRAFGYDSDAAGSNDKGAGAYSFSENFTRMLTAKLNIAAEESDPRWLPHQVQAAIWSAMKARHELPSVKEATWLESLDTGHAFINDNGVRTVKFSKADRQAHRNIWLKHANAVSSKEATDAAVASSASFEDFIERMTQTVTWEAIPSPDFDHPIMNAPPEVQRLFTRLAKELILDEDGNDLLAAQLGVFLARVDDGSGLYMGYLSPNNLSQLTPTKGSGAFGRDEVRLYAKAIQYIFKQNAVPWFRADNRAMLSKKGREDQMFRLVNAKGNTVSGSKVETLAEAQALLEEKGEGFEIRGGKFARGIVVEFDTDFDGQSLNDLIRLMVSEYGADSAGFTRISPNEIAMINFRDEQTGVPWTSDEDFVAAITAFADKHKQELGIANLGDFWSEGEYGVDYDGQWKQDPEGEGLLSDPAFKGSQDLQSWIRGRRVSFDKLLQDFSQENLDQRQQEAQDLGILFQAGQTTLDQKNEARREAVALRDYAESQREQYIADVERVAEAVNGEIPDGSEKNAVKKNIQRMIDKILKKKKRNRVGPHITDALRWTIVTNDVSDPDNGPQKVIDKITAEFEKLGYKIWVDPNSGKEDLENRYESDSGYKDIAFKFDKGDGLIRELLVISPSMMWAKNKFIGHKIYDVTRELEQIKDWGADQQDVDDLKKSLIALSDKLYKAALNSDLAAFTNATSSSLSQPNIANESRSSGGTGSPESFSRTSRSILNAFSQPFLAKIAKALAASKADKSLFSLMGSPPSIDTVAESVSEDNQIEYDPIQEGETVKQWLKRAVDTQDLPGKLPEDPTAYFDIKGEPQLVDLDRLLLSKDSDARDGENAAKRMKAAADGQVPKRVPIDVTDNGDGTYTVIDGNGTVAGARLFDWEKMPVNIVDDVESYQQTGGNTDPNAAILPAVGKMRIFLFEKANLSSIPHEFGHLFLEDMRTTAEQDGVMVAEWEAVKEWLGSADGVFTKEQHERFARGFEKYLREGVAPSIKLRGAFRSFKKWLTRIYRSAKDLNVDIPDDIREVFDKLLATEDEIAEAKATAAMTKMFDDAFLSGEGLGDDFIRQYSEITGRTLDEASDDMDKHRLAGRDERQRIWREQAEKESWQQKLYRGIYLLSRGTEPQGGGKVGQGIGISIEEAVAVFGQEAYDKMPKIPGLFRTEGASLEQAAAEAGFASVSELGESLQNMQKRTDWVDKRVSHLESEYDKQLPAEEAIRNEAAAKQLETESKVLATYAKKVAATRKALRAWAEKVTAGQVLGQATDIYRLIQTSRKLRRQALAAAKAGDYAAAFTKNEQVRLNEELILVHTKVRDQLKKIEKRMNGRANANIALDYRNQLNVLLQRFGLTKKNLQIDADTKTLEQFINSLIPNDEVAIMAMPTFAPWLADGAARPYKSLTWQEMQDVADLADFLYGRGREVLNNYLSDQKTTVEELAEETAAESKDVKGKKIFKENTFIRGKIEAIRKYFAGTDQLIWIFRAMDGYKNTGGGKSKVGSNERNLWYRIAHAVRKKSFMMQEKTEALKPHLDVLVAGAKDKPNLFTHVRVPDKLAADGRGWTWERIVMVALNMGNEGNLTRLMEGYGMTAEELVNLTAVLTQGEWQAIQGIIDVIDGMHPDINAVHQRINHFSLHKVEAEPLHLEAQPAGEINGIKIPARPDMMLRGGYFPIKYDKGLSLRVMEWTERDDILSSHEAILQTPAAKSGFTKTRTKGVTLPLDLSFNVITQHIHDTVQYITHAEAVRDVDRVTQTEVYQKAALRAIGEEGYKMIRPSLKYAMRPEKEFGGQLDGFIARQRVKSSIFVLAWNFRTALLQPTAATLAIRRIGPVNFAKGLLKMSSNPLEAIASMQALSPFMRERAKNLDRDLIDARKAMKAKSRFGMSKYDRVVEAGFIPIQVMDALISYPTWHGAYKLGLKKFQGDQDKAVLFADDAVRTTSGSGTSIDLSAFQRDTRGWMQLFTMFSSFTMGYGNMQRSSYNAWRTGTIGTPEYTYDFFMTAIIPSVSATLAYALLTTGEPPEPEDLFADVVSWQFMGLPFVRDMAGFMFNTYGSTGAVVRSPALLGMDLLGAVGRDAFVAAGDMFKNGELSRKTQKKIAWDLANLASYTLKIPASKIYERIMLGVEQMEDGAGGPWNLLLPDKSKK